MSLAGFGTQARRTAVPLDGTASGLQRWLHHLGCQAGVLCTFKYIEVSCPRHDHAQSYNVLRQTIVKHRNIPYFADPSPGILPQEVRAHPGHRSTPVVQPNMLPETACQADLPL